MIEMMMNGGGVVMEVGAVIDGDIVIGQDGNDWVLIAGADRRAVRAWGLYGTDTTLPNNPSPDPNTGAYNTDVLTSSSYNTINDGQGSTGSPAAEYCRALGMDLPNRNVLPMIVENITMIDGADPSVDGTTTQPTLLNIRDGSARDDQNKASHYPGIALSSTEDSSDFCVTQSFTGGQDNDYKAYEFWALPVRRVPV